MGGAKQSQSSLHGHRRRLGAGQREKEGLMGELSYPSWLPDIGCAGGVRPREHSMARSGLIHDV